MKYVQLGSSDLSVSEVCLGTMTWGQQNTQAQAFEQIHYALGQGINFLDTAEMYSVPPKAETQGSTETILGNWLKENAAKRDRLVIASKISGANISWIRNGEKMSGKGVREAVDGSLKRLQTDYIDLYQLHWPNRPNPHFGRHWPNAMDYSNPETEQVEAEMLDILQGLDDCIKAGKIRYCGLSNETAWGIGRYREIARENNLPQMVSIQNEFNLWQTKDWPQVFESCAHNNMAYLPWSPLSGGALSGKYRNNALPPNSRWTMLQRNGLFRNTPQAAESIEAYYLVAQKHKLSLAQMALAWVYRFKGVTSTIIGATTMDQLKEDIGAYELCPSDELQADIDAVLRRFPAPF